MCAELATRVSPQGTVESLAFAAAAIAVVSKSLHAMDGALGGNGFGVSNGGGNTALGLKICESCQRSHPGDYGSGRFCSSRCARLVGGIAIKRKRDMEDMIMKTIENKIKRSKLSRDEALRVIISAIEEVPLPLQDTLASQSRLDSSPENNAVEHSASATRAVSSSSPNNSRSRRQPLGSLGDELVLHSHSHPFGQIRSGSSSIAKISVMNLIDQNNGAGEHPHHSIHNHQHHQYWSSSNP